MATRVLFVCLGNICRSPSAESVLRFKALRGNINVETDSAGTGDWHVGDPPYGPMRNALESRGYDTKGMRARQVTREDFDRFDLIVAMDRDNLSHLARMQPAGSATPLKLFTDFAPETGMDHVPDPYYTRDFDGCLDLVETCADGLLRSL